MNLQIPFQPELSKSFASHCHSASIRAVAASERYVASGGADDKVFIFDMLKRQEISLLNHQRGTVTTLAFSPDTSHLFVGDASGAMIAYSTSTWEVHKQWLKAHKGHGINLIRVHPSGKLAVTLGAELNMQMWNLIRGTCVNTTNLKVVPELGKTVDCLEWSESGDNLAISGAKVVQIWDTRSAECQRSFATAARPTAIVWLNDTDLVIGMENGQVLFRRHADDDEANATEPVAVHEKRVKGMALQGLFLSTISSDGQVALWKLAGPFGQLKKVTATNIGCRPTCVTLLDNSSYASMKPEEANGSVDVDETPKRALKRSAGQLTKGSVEVIEDEADTDDDEQETPPPLRSSKRNNRKSIPGQFVLTPARGAGPKTANKKTNPPTSSKKKTNSQQMASKKLNSSLNISGKSSKNQQAKKQKLNKTLT